MNFIMPSSDPDRVARDVVSAAPDVIGFSCYLWNSQSFLDALPAIRRGLPLAVIVLGGPDANPRAESLLAERPEVDLVALGEGEVTLPAILRARRDGASWDRVPGVAYRGADGGAVRTPEPPLLDDLDVLPSPLLSGALAFTEEHTRITIETSRGCPFNCSFCDWPGRSQKPRNFSIDRVVRELELLAGLPKRPEVVHLADADIFIDKKRAAELLTRARKALAGTDVVLAMEAYLGRLDDDLLRILDSPNFAIEAGIQTATPEALEAVNRFFHREKIESVMARARTVAPGVRMALQLIFGLPGDSLEGFKSTLDWALSLGAHRLVAYPALVLPGSDMGLHPERFDMVFDPKPPRRIRSTSRFPESDLRRANAIAARVAAVSALLPMLGASVARPTLALYEAFGAALSREGLLANQASLEAVDDPCAHGIESGKAIARADAGRARARELLDEALKDASVAG
jgi:radical SAM superfamily enzyme YgiQ (UPF0313 family)